MQIDVNVGDRLFFSAPDNQPMIMQQFKIIEIVGTEEIISIIVERLTEPQLPGSPKQIAFTFQRIAAPVDPS